MKNNDKFSVDKSAMDLYNSELMPLSNCPTKRKIQEKKLQGKPLTPLEIMTLGLRDRVVKKIGNYECKPDHCYRAINEETFKLYNKYGYIKDERKREYVEGDGNQGIDWYLGGACPGKRYGSIIIECPADKNYFIPTHDNGLDLANDLSVRHMKSSSNDNPIPLSMITNVFDYRKIFEEQIQEFINDRAVENKKIDIQRQEEITLIEKEQQDFTLKKSKKPVKKTI